MRLCSRIIGYYTIDKPQLTDHTECLQTVLTIVHNPKMMKMFGEHHHEHTVTCRFNKCFQTWKINQILVYNREMITLDVAVQICKFSSSASYVWYNNLIFKTARFRIIQLTDVNIRRCNLMDGASCKRFGREQGLRLPPGENLSDVNVDLMWDAYEVGRLPNRNKVGGDISLFKLFRIQI